MNSPFSLSVSHPGDVAGLAGRLSRRVHAPRPEKSSGLDERDRDAIVAMAERGLTSAQIALKLNKHTGTVSWFMYAQGLKKRGATGPRARYTRKGLVVQPFCDDEDRFIEACRLDGLPDREICRQIEVRFGHVRKRRAIRVRLLMLASYAEAEAI